MRLIDIEPFKNCRITLNREDTGIDIKDLKTVEAPHWISVGDALPEDGESVLAVVYAKAKNITFEGATEFAYCERRKTDAVWYLDDWDIDGDDIRCDKVTHWMRIPEAPKEEEV